MARCWHGRRCRVRACAHACGAARARPVQTMEPTQTLGLHAITCFHSFPCLQSRVCHLQFNRVLLEDL